MLKNKLAANNEEEIKEKQKYGQNWWRDLAVGNFTVVSDIYHID